MNKRLILLADDEPHITHVVGSKLKGAGYDVAVAGDGEEALAVAQDRLPDLIVTDLQMPYMSGMEFAQALMEREDTRRIPVIMLTARGYVLDAQGASITNIRAVLSKPFSARDVLARVKSMLGSDVGRSAA